MLDLTAHSVLYAFLPNINDGIDLLAANNGTGFPDFKLDGLTTAGLIDNHQYAFFARMTNTNDGPDSFFIVATVPGPVVGAGIPGLLIACGTLWGFARNRRRRNDPVVA